jgi:hypothetical protein
MLIGFNRKDLFQNQHNQTQQPKCDERTAHAYDGHGGPESKIIHMGLLLFAEYVHGV